MNVRKAVDYTAMFAALDALMAAGLPQMELYCEIGKLISSRPEKGVAIAANMAKSDHKEGGVMFENARATGFSQGIEDRPSI